MEKTFLTESSVHKQIGSRTRLTSSCLPGLSRSFLTTVLCLLSLGCSGGLAPNKDDETQPPPPPAQEGPTNPPTAPSSPNALSLVSPSWSPSNDATPTIRVSGVKSSAVVTIYTDANCTTEVGSATSSGTTVDITTSVLVVGNYTFYANTKETSTSACSSASLSYSLTSCPTGYIPVPGDVSLGTNNFCVMQFEAKAWNDLNANASIDPGEVDPDGCGEAECSTANWAVIPNYKPVSQTENVPWRQIDQNRARDACSALNSEGNSNYGLISNPEWMTIARNIENQDANWSGSLVGNGVILQGNTAADSEGSYDGANPEGGSDRNTKARHVLSNGQQIWDVSGNISEWVDWNILPAEKAYVSNDGSPQMLWREFTQLDTLVGLMDAMVPKSWQPSNPSLDRTQGTGSYYAGNNTSGGAARRGGQWDSGSPGGIYALHLGSAATSENDYIGFRCVFRP